MSDFEVAIFWYFNTQKLHETHGIFKDETNRLNSSPSHKFTNQGPPKYQGSVLDDPDAVWIEDEWDQNRIEHAEFILKAQYNKVDAFWKKKYITEAGSYWHQFYRRNQDNFYKDRHYLHIVFPELSPDYCCKNRHNSITTNDISQSSSSTNYDHSNSNNNSSSVNMSKNQQYDNSKMDDNLYRFNLLEVGCGVGNAVLPLLEINPYIHIVALDFAKSAIEILKSHPLYQESHQRIQAYQHDISQTHIPLPVLPKSMDAILCMYVLSAINPEKHIEIFQQLGSYLKIGGHILMRDYGRYDEAQLRFKPTSKLDTNLYVRQDGTLTYYFSTDDIQHYCDSYYEEYIDDGDNNIVYYDTLQVVENKYITRQYANRLQQKARYRVWLHAKIQKVRHKKEKIS